MILFRYFIIFAWFCAPLAAHAARPMVTDDARLTKAGTEQIAKPTPSEMLEIGDGHH